MRWRVRARAVPTMVAQEAARSGDGVGLPFPYVVFHAAAIFHLPLPRYDPTWRQLIKQAQQAHMHGTWMQAVTMGTASLADGSSFSIARRHCQLPRAVHIRTVRGPSGSDCPCHTSPLEYPLVLGGALVCWGWLQYVQLHQGQWWPAPSGFSCQLAATAFLVATARRSVQFRQSLGDVGELGRVCARAGAGRVLPGGCATFTSARCCRPHDAHTYLTQSDCLNGGVYNWGLV